MKYCVKCEKNFFGDQVFCSDCGSELITKESDVASSPENETLNVQNNSSINSRRIKLYNAIIISESIIIVLMLVIFLIGWLNGNIDW